VGKFGFKIQEKVTMKSQILFSLFFVLVILGCQTSEPVQKNYSPIAEPSDGSIQIVSFKVNGIPLDEKVVVKPRGSMDIELKFIRHEPKTQPGFVSTWAIYAQLEKDRGNLLAGSVTTMIQQNLISLPTGRGELTFRQSIPVPSVEELVPSEKLAGKKIFHFALIDQGKIVVARQIDYAE